MNEDLRSLSTIDFLPQRYREAKVKRSASVWRLLVVLMFAALLLSTSYFQQQFLWKAQSDLMKINLVHAASVKIAQEMAQEQARLPVADNEAELFTYLRHPWPRTQILSAILAPVPPAVRLTSLQLSLELPETPVLERDQTAKDDPVDKLPSPARDLKRLRQEIDGGHWVVLLSGTTTDLAELHIYLAKLEQQKIFTKVELVSIDSSHTAEISNSQFAARVTIRPGYGQPGGPSPDVDSVSKATVANGRVR